MSYKQKLKAILNCFRKHQRLNLISVNIALESNGQKAIPFDEMHELMRDLISLGYVEFEPQEKVNSGNYHADRFYSLKPEARAAYNLDLPFKDLINPNVERPNSMIPAKPPIRSRVEMIAWIIGIIGGLAAIWEFLLKHWLKK